VLVRVRVRVRARVRVRVRVGVRARARDSVRARDRDRDRANHVQQELDVRRARVARAHIVAVDLAGADVAHLALRQRVRLLRRQPRARFGTAGNLARRHLARLARLARLPAGLKLGLHLL
jgi:hypothetical protein